MKRFLFPVILVSAATAGFACSSGSSGPALDVDPGGDAVPADHPPIDPSKRPVESATTRRLSVAQLRGSFPVAMGKDELDNDITWILYSKPALDRLSDVLGEADYANRTDDNLEPSPLYVKFMDAAARDVCNRTLAADALRTDATTRVLTRYVEKIDTVATNPTGVDANLRYLKLRFHGVKVQEGDDTLIAPLRTLFTEAVTAAAAGGTVYESDVKEGWRVVCVALLTAPEFHLY